MQSSRIRAEVQVDSHIMVPRNRKSVTIEALALIHNDSDDHFVLAAADSASAHGWQILDAGGREVARHVVGKAKKVRGASETFCSTMVPSHHSIREHESIKVDAAKLKDGARYVLRHNHWGYTGEAEFVAVHDPERAVAKKKVAKKARRKPTKNAASKAKAAPRKKAAARKKVAKKGAAAGKPAGKKAARKKGPGKK